jgi:predicted Kef-type K+ transport protein
VNHTAVGNISSATSNGDSLPSIISPVFSIGTDLSQILVFDLAIIMIVAAGIILLTYKLKQPMILGYIVAGILIGPYTPPFTLVSSIETVNMLAELGIIMLLFVIGTEFPISKLKSVGRISMIVAFFRGTWNSDSGILYRSDSRFCIF